MTPHYFCHISLMLLSGAALAPPPAPVPVATHDVPAQLATAEAAHQD